MPTAAAKRRTTPRQPTVSCTPRRLRRSGAGATDKDYAAVGRATPRALAIPFYQTIAGRAFSMLKNLAAQNRLRAGGRYRMNLMMLTFNEPYYIMLSDAELRTLGADDLLKALRS